MNDNQCNAKILKRKERTFYWKGEGNWERSESDTLLVNNYKPMGGLSIGKVCMNLREIRTIISGIIGDLNKL